MTSSTVACLLAELLQLSIGSIGPGYCRIHRLHALLLLFPLQLQQCLQLGHQLAEQE